MEGERKQVSVLFADVKGSMELAEGLDPEEWHRILDRFFLILSEGVHRFEGTVNQYTGDGIMALFGAPIAHEDHAQRACYAALHLQESLRRYADELRRTRGLNFAVRMGINSGEVVVGKIGDDLRMDYTAQGHTVGLAARLQQLAAADRIYLTEHTARLVQGYFALRDLGSVQVKGVSQPVRAYELEGAGELRTRLDRSRARGFSRFVGREREMEVLRHALTRTLQGTGSVVGVVGEAGVGKSRLCHEFAQRCRARGLEVNETHCVSYGRSIPFLAVLDHLRALFGVGEHESSLQIRQKVAGTLLLLDETLCTNLPLVFDFMGVPDPERPPAATSPTERQQAFLDFLQRLIAARSRQGPGVIVLEDLHWIDAASDAALAHLANVIPQTRTLLLVNYRPEYQAPWMNESFFEELPLAPLGGEAIDALLNDLLGTGAELQSLSSRIRERTTGNPFFIEEVVQSLFDQGVLIRDPSGQVSLRSPQPVGDIEIPATVHAVLAARIDRLPELEKEVLQTAAVIGKEFAEPVLRSVTAASLKPAPTEEDVAHALRRLEDGEFVRQAALYPTPEYAFKHPLTQEVAYRSQLHERKRRTHAAVARELVAQVAESLDERAALVAHHWEEAGESFEAARWHRRAADWAAGKDSNEAVSHLRRVFSLLERIPETPEAMMLRLTAAQGILRAGPFAGLSEAEAREIFEASRRVGEKLPDRSLLAQLVSTYGYFTGMAGDSEQARAYVREAATLAETTEDERLLMRLQLDDAQMDFWTGRLREALQATERLIERYEAGAGIAAGTDFAVGLGWAPFLFALRGQLLVFMGRPREGAADLDRALEMEHARGTPEGLCIGYCFRSLADYVLGDAESATRHGRAALENAEKIGSTFLRSMANLAMGNAHVLRSNWHEAKAYFESAGEKEPGEEMSPLVESFLLPLLAQACIGAGDYEQGARIASEAIQAARQRGMAHIECMAQLALARALLGTRRAEAVEESREILARVQRLIDDTGFVSEQPRLHEVRASLAGLLGDEGEWRNELEEAHRLYLNMGAEGHAQHVARELESVAP
jgi:class 3 adenylate cyclase/tetratricopeptide (TPR) repeat protein